MDEPITLANGREVISEVLLKLKTEALSALPMACKTCPSAMWQITGKPDRPDAVTVRCYCPVMHTFTWDSINREEILDCDRLYLKEDEEEPLDEMDDSELPPYLRQQRELERNAAQQEMEGAEFAPTLD